MVCFIMYILFFVVSDINIVYIVININFIYIIIDIIIVAISKLSRLQFKTKWK